MLLISFWFKKKKKFKVISDWQKFVRTDKILKGIIRPNDWHKNFFLSKNSAYRQSRMMNVPCIAILEILTSEYFASVCIPSTCVLWRYYV